MFKTLKNTITDLAKLAVNYAENKLSTSTGKEKKKLAVNYVVNKLVVPPVFKPFLVIFFSSFIDKSIEKAVEYMKQLQNED